MSLTKHRFTVLDIFRGIFASFVVFYHMSSFSKTVILNNSFIYNTDMFVDFFFVLSGFVVCYSYRTIDSGKRLKDFLLKRFFRLYPLHLTMLLAFLAIEGVKIAFQNQVHINNSLDNSPYTFLTSLFLINSIKFPWVHNYSWNGVSWSISAELISYIVFSLLCFILSTLNLNKIKPFIYLFISLLAFFILTQITHTTELHFGYNYGFLRGLTGFFAGTVCFYAFNNYYEKLKKINNKLFSCLEIILLLAITYMITNGDFFKIYGFTYELAFFIAIFIFAFEKGIISNLLKKSNFLKNTGKYSYSIYMIHPLLISIFNVILIRILKLPDTAYWWIFIINYAAIYIISSWTYKYIEMRFQKKQKSANL